MTPKEYFFKYKTLILYGITALLFSIIGMHQCSTHRAELKAAKAAQQAHELKIKNEVQTYYLQRETAKLDSLKAVEAANTFKAKTDALIYKSEAERLRKITIELEKKYNILIAENTPCPDLLEAAIIRIDTLKAENTALENECTALGNEAEGYSRQLYMCEQQRSIANTLLNSAKLEIKADQLLIDNYKKQVQAEQAKGKFVKLITGTIILVETVLLIIN